MGAERGFTLIEVLIVVSIFGVLTAIAAPFAADFVTRNRLNATARELLADLQRMRQNAMTGSAAPNGRGFGIRFVSATSYRLFEFDDADGDFRYDAGEESENPPPLERDLAGPLQISIDGGTVAGNVLLFDKYGFSRSSSWSSASGRTYEIARTGRKPERCITVSFVRIREGACK